MNFPRRARLAGWALCLLVHGGLAHGASLEVAPAGNTHDLTFYSGKGLREEGEQALAAMQTRADLVVWWAGNQFVAVPDLVAAFQRLYPGVAIGVITLPPELELRAVQAGGWTFRGHAYPGRPDIYGSVTTTALQDTGLIREYVAYAHNEMQLMVRAGNPKRVRDLRDLVRPDLRVVLPNALDEGIMKDYGEPILKGLGIWGELGGEPPCRDCDRQGHVHFTAVHHRESLARLLQGEADVALVWRTEVEQARRQHDPVEGVALPGAQSGRNVATYYAGILDTAGHAALARRFLEFLDSPAGQAVYIAHGFVGIEPTEHALLPLAEAGVAVQ